VGNLYHTYLENLQFNQKNLHKKSFNFSKYIPANNLIQNSLLKNSNQTPFVSSLRYFSQKLTHVDELGKLQMVDVSSKPITIRQATAFARILLNDAAFNAVKLNKISKGDVLTTTRIAAITASKKCSSLIPLCHQISLTSIKCRLEMNEELKAVDIWVSTKAKGETGVEMEALTGASVAALTIYDMCKSLSRDSVISDVKLVKKSGGSSGSYYLNENNKL